MNTPGFAIRAIALWSVVVTAVSLSAADVRVYVRFNPNQRAAAEAALTQSNARQHHAFDNLNAVAVTVPEAARDALARNPAIVRVEEDPVRGFLAQSTQGSACTNCGLTARRWRVASANFTITTTMRSRCRSIG